MQNSKKSMFMPHKSSKVFITKMSIVLAILSVATAGCKKYNGDVDRDYGYAKVIVACDKCAVSYTSAGQLNEFVVDGSSAINYIRYKQDYTLDINIKSLVTDQDLNLSVYSRSGKQVFLKTTAQKANDTWNSKIIIP